MLRTNTALWRIAFLSGLGVLPGACGAQMDTPLPEQADDDPVPGASTGTTSPDAVEDLARFAHATPCLDPVPQVVAGAYTGLERCSDGRLHRAAAVQCNSSLPRTEPSRMASTICNADSDCTEKPLGFCGLTPKIFFTSSVCQYGCLQDSDCGAGFLCRCGDPVGTCVASNCQTDSDCGNGLLCAAVAPSSRDACSTEVVFSCETPADSCRTQADCSSVQSGYHFCGTAADARTCATDLGACGRPFLVEGSARLASLVRCSDWRGARPAPDCSALRATERSELARAWSELGLMEHASVAAFARFTLQLLSLGAPAALVEQSQRALADELLHARLCFSLASEYAGEALGPGPLPTDHALDLTALEDIVALTLHEGCVGETIAALEASEALAVASDPAVREVLARIAADERRHAELAWRFVSWARGVGGPRVQRRIERELAQLLAKASPPRPAVEQSFDGTAHGILPASHRAALRDAALRDVVLPCAEALLPAAGPAQGDGSKPAFA